MEKWFLQSKTIWGGIILFIVSMLPVIQNFLGVSLTADEVREFGDAGGRLIENIVAVAGFILVVLGRWRAQKNLTITP
jgi:hypothetical protein